MKRTSKCAIAVAIISVVLAGPASGAFGKGTDIFVPTIAGGQLRDFRFYVSPRVPSLQPVPLLLVLHGLYLDASTAEASSGLDDVADTEGIAVAYPYGLNGSWNAGRCCGASANKVDDVGFLTQIVSLVASIRPIDMNRVYIAGFSNGGMMALRAICERPDVFAAAASVSGTLESSCAGARPINAIMINGLRDQTVPFNGSKYSSFLSTSLTPLPNAAQTLAHRSGCTVSTVRTSSLIRDELFTRCDSGAAVELIAEKFVGHAWPTQEHDGISGENLVWSFLSVRSLSK